MVFVMDIWNAVHTILTTSDLLTLGLMAIIALGTGLMMQSFGSIVSATVVALIAFALAGYVRAVATGGQNAVAFASKDWQAFLGLHMLTLVAYAVAFAAVIALVHIVRSLVGR